MKKFAIEFRWGITYFLAYTLWLMLEKSAGFHDEKIMYQPVFHLLFFFVALTLYGFMLRDKKKNFFTNQMHWRDGFFSGLMYTFIIAMLSVMSVVTFHEWLSPHFLTDMKNLVVAQKQLTEEEATEFFSFSKVLSQHIYMILSQGAILSAMWSYFLKTKELK